MLIRKIFLISVILCIALPIWAQGLKINSGIQTLFDVSDTSQTTGSFLRYNGSTGWLDTSDTLRFTGDSLIVLGVLRPNSLVLQAFAFPDSDGTNTQVLKTNGSGSLFWADDSTGSGSGVADSAFELSSGVIREQTSSTQYANDFLVGSPQLTDDGTAAHDKRMFFDKSTYSFRAGSANSTQWNTGGDGSVAFGLNNKSVGNYSFTFGNSNDVQVGGIYSGAFGNSNTIVDDWDYAFGTSNNINNGTGYSLAVGNTNTIQSDYSFAFGYSNFMGTTSSKHSYALGDNNTINMSSSPYAFAMGYDNSVSAIGGVAIGYENSTSGDYAFSFGKYMQLSATADGSFLFGQAGSAQTLNQANTFYVFPSGTAGNFAFGQTTTDSSFCVTGSSNFTGNMNIDGSLLVEDTLYINSVDSSKIYYSDDTLYISANNVKIGNNSLIIDSDGNIKIDTLENYINYNVKVNRLADYTATDTDYNIFQWDTMSPGGTRGNFTFNFDSTGITVPSNGLYEYRGCFHLKNTAGGPSNVKFNSYMYAGTDTSYCSQISEEYDSLGGGTYKNITYGGVMRLNTSNPLIVMIKVSDTDLILSNDPDLPRPVAASLNLTKISN